MGETPIIEGLLQYPSVESLDDVVEDLQHAGYLTDDEQWVSHHERLNPLGGEKEPVSRDARTLRIPEGAYRNIHRGLSKVVAEADTGGVVGTMRLRRIGLIGTAEDQLQFVDLESWGISRGRESPPCIEDAEYAEEARDEWFREAADTFVDQHRSAIRGRLNEDGGPVATAAVPQPRYGDCSSVIGDPL